MSAKLSSFTIGSVRSAMDKIGSTWSHVHVFADDLYEMYLRPLPLEEFRGAILLENGIVRIPREITVEDIAPKALSGSLSSADRIISLAKRGRGVEWPVLPMALLVSVAIDDDDGSEFIASKLAIEYDYSRRLWHAHRGGLILWAQNHMAPTKRLEMDAPALKLVR